MKTHNELSKPVFPRVLPYIQFSTADGHQYENFCQQQLMLHKPSRALDQLKNPNQSWSSALISWIQAGGYVPQKTLDALAIEEHEELDSSSSSSSDDELNLESSQDLADWMLAGRPKQLPRAIPTDNYDWTSYWQSLSDLAVDAETFINKEREQNNIEFTTDADASNLNPHQLKAYNILCKALLNESPPVRMFVSGTAGSGKSHLINCIRRFAVENFSENVMCVCAPTGTASFNIMGRTIHSALSLPVPIGKDLPDLKSRGLLNFQERLKSVRMIIIDEMSMIGRKMLRCIDLRLRQINPRNSHLFFGGLSICLLGDFGQLPPVLDAPMFSRKLGKDTNPLSEEGQLSFQSFDKAVILTTVERVRGNDERQTRFRRVLSNLRNGCVTPLDHAFLHQRLESNLTANEVAEFHHAPRLVSKHDSEIQINEDLLLKLNKPICTITAAHKPADAENGSPQDAMGLEKNISIAIGAKVMLRSNLYVSAGLTNGSIGTVHGILYNPQLPGPNSLPTAVCVNFPEYQGNPWNPRHPKVVPIPPFTATWPKGTQVYSRTQIPLSLAFATTIHKSQGWTKSRIVVDIGKKELNCGLSFVAFSRVKSIDGIMISPSNPTYAQWSRFLAINNHKGQEQRAFIDEYLYNLSMHT